jgi:hypothetical protein
MTLPQQFFGGFMSPEIWCPVGCLAVQSVSYRRIVFMVKGAKQTTWTIGITWRGGKGASAPPIFFYMRIIESVRTVCIWVESAGKRCMCIED